MQKASLPETYGPFLGRSVVEEFVEAGSVERYFEEHWPEATVATDGDRVVGVVVLRDALVDLVWVTPPFRSQGIGAALMAHVEGVAAAGELTLEVWKVNRRAVEFYERLGFGIACERDDPDTGLVKLVMRKRLRR
jgi:ribosomal protein S18 acetylase RimI-like enzyme